MLNESVKPVNVLILTEFSLSGYEFVAQERVKLGLINEYQADEILEIIASHRAINSRNAKLVHENDELMAENEKCKAAYDKCATGGNSLASVIIGWDLPSGWQDWTYIQANDFLHNLYGINSNMAYERYEIWLCWKSIREAGQTLEGSK